MAYNITNQENSEKKEVKRKASTSKNILKSKKNRINISQESDFKTENHQTILQIEMEEHKMQLLERKIANHKAQAEIERLKLENLKLRKKLDS